MKQDDLIKQLKKQKINLTARSIQYYRDEGLIPYGKTPKANGGFVNTYDKMTIERISWIQRMLKIGFTIQEVKNLLGNDEDYLIDKCGFFIMMMQEAFKFRGSDTELRLNVTHEGATAMLVPIKHKI